jgi:predicted DNA-binding transcriptional regulator AlpA
MVALSKLITPAETAAMLGLQEETLNVWRCKKKGPSYTKIGSRVMYRAEDLQSYIESRLVTPPAPEPAGA